MQNGHRHEWEDRVLSFGFQEAGKRVGVGRGCGREEERGGKEENSDEQLGTHSLLSFLAPMDTVRNTAGLSGEGWKLASFLQSQNTLEMWPLQEGLTGTQRLRRQHS